MFDVWERGGGFVYVARKCKKILEPNGTSIFFKNFFFTKEPLKRILKSGYETGPTAGDWRLYSLNAISTKGDISSLYANDKQCSVPQNPINDDK